MVVLVPVVVVFLFIIPVAVMVAALSIVFVAVLFVVGIVVIMRHDCVAFICIFWMQRYIPSLATELQRGTVRRKNPSTG